jgi:DNA-binding CsgD family transcriptional regulator
VAIETSRTLLERQRELAELSEALTQAQQGRGAVVLVEAPAGLGKTSLLRTTLDAAAAAGFTCLRARATDLEHDFAYGCVRQLLEPMVAKATGARREQLFAGAAAHASVLFAPSGTAEALPSDASAFSMLHGLYWLLNNLAEEGPVVLCVDDLHWSDPESLRFLGYLAPRLDGLSLAVLAGTRPGEGDTAALARLAAAPEATVTRPQPLSAKAIATLCERRLDAPVAPEFAVACREATGGNPFFLDALLREAIERNLPPDASQADPVRGLGPGAVAQAVLLRLSGKPAAATALVRAIAVLGDGVSLAEAAHLADVSEDEAARAVDLLASLEILQPANGLEFAHPIVREAVYADIGARERARAHARAVVTLTASGASEERIAAQIVQAEPAGDTARVELLRRVAADALARGAPAAAVAWLARALAEPPPPETRTEVLLELGLAEQRLGAPGAVDHLAAAIESIREPQRLATAVRQLANALTISGNSDRAVEALASAIALVEPQDRQLTLLLEAELASHALQGSPEVAAAARRRLERRGDLGGTTERERLLLASLAFQRARAAESAGDAAEILEGVLVGGLLDAPTLDIVGPFYDLVVALLATDALDVAVSYIERALADARGRASIPATAFLTGRRGWVSLRRGAVDQAEADARTAVGLLTTYGIPLGVPFATALLVEALLERGELDAAEHAVMSSGVADELPPGPTNNFFLESKGALQLALGRTQDGLDLLVEFGRRDELWGAANPLASRWRSRAALALSALGDGEAARRMAADDLERARRWGAAGGVGVALRTVAVVEGPAAPIDLLRESADVLQRSPARLEHARSLTELGAALRRANRRAEARDALEQGLELADRLGGRALAERARTELRAAGGRSSDPHGTGVEQLTASERRVAELAAQGHSNPEIAQALFVTRKTVETHLGHVYRKLDISGRGQLRAALPDRI